MLQTIGWGTHQERTSLICLRGTALNERCLDIVRRIKQTRANRLRAHLSTTNKYKFLISQCPEHNQRGWINWSPRWGRTNISRLFLASHRLIIETGRWRRWPRPYRTCKHCVLPGCATAGCQCANEQCVGTEAHFVWVCERYKHH